MKRPNKTHKYSRKDIQDELEQYYLSNEGNLSEFYRDCHYRSSTLHDSDMTAIEVIAEYVMNNWVDSVGGKPILRGVSGDDRPEYCDSPRDEKPKRRKEEVFQRGLYFGRIKMPNELETMLKGEEFIWFELSPDQRIKGGIDLISFNQALNRLSIYELKYGFANEHILKAILEIQTYFQRTRFDKFKTHWNQNKQNCSKPIKTFKVLDFDENNVRKVILIDKRIRNFAESEYESIKFMIEKFNIVTMYFDGGSL